MVQDSNRVSNKVSVQQVLAHDLVEWYWTDGCRRSERPAGAAEWEGDYEQFALSTGSWLRQLYKVRDRLAVIIKAVETERPAVALWGMSQTGKSTSVSAFVDEKVQVSETNPQIDGTLGGLHWPGGLPFFFVAPHRDTEQGDVYPLHWYERSLNPFNSGLDASSCLSRFVAGSLTPQTGCVRVKDPLHPVQVNLVPPGDLLHALARGFDSECLGPALKGKQEEWTVERFDRMLALFREKRRTENPPAPHRLAYERMLACVTTLNDLVSARVETFAGLRTNDVDWQSRLEALLSDPILIGDPQAADDFAAEVFWCSSPIFTARFKAMRALHDQLVREWGDRPVFASLPAAALLLDMAASVNAFKPRHLPETREGKQQRLIDALGFRVVDDHIQLGCGPEYSSRLGSSAEQFSNFQGLVWELIIPVNVGNLSPSPFLDLIAEADLLDFPGVGRDEKNETNRLNADPKRLGASSGQPCTVESFYSEIVKRGKTASIVATYSRRLSIDAFSILQNIDKDEPSNHATDQIANGIRTWLRNMAPEFVEGAGERPSGVFLNLGLTFWGEFVDQSKPDRALNFEMRKKFYGKLGVLADPAVTTIFALNYHWMKGPRVKFTQPFRKGAPLYERVTSEQEFQRMFRNPVSRQSLEEMTEDVAGNESGGADFLFRQLGEQVRTLGAEARSARFTAAVEQLRQTLQSLLAWRHLRKPVADTDNRIEEIDAFLTRSRIAIENRTEAGVRRASYALSELLGVNPESIVLPPLGRPGLTADYVGKLFNEWRNRQVRRYDEGMLGGKSNEPEWSGLGFTRRDQIERFLEALINCLPRAVLQAIATMAIRAWDTIPGPDSHRQQHLRRYLALEMTNRLVYKSPGERPPPAIRPPASPLARGSATAAYAAFIGPFLDGQLVATKKHLTPVVLRPPLVGDDTLEKILSGVEL